MHYYLFNIADYQSHTKHLTPIEDICYRRLLDWQYLHEKPIPNDIKSMCRLLMLRDYQTDVEQVLNEFFVLTNDGWVNNRAFSEISQYQLKSKKASDAGKASAAKRLSQTIIPELSDCSTSVQQTFNERSTDVQPNNNQEPLTINQETSTNNQEPLEEQEEKSESQSEDCSSQKQSPFDLFWAAYPKKVGKDKARSAFKKIKRPSEEIGLILAALEWQISFNDWTKDNYGFIPHPSKYLNEGRWKDERPPDNVIWRRRKEDYPPAPKWKNFNANDYNNGNDGYGNPRQPENKIIDITDYVDEPSEQQQIGYRTPF